MPLAARVADVVQGRARDRGVFGDSGRWLAIWVAVTGLRWIIRKGRPEPVVVRQKLEPGQRLVITHFAKDGSIGVSGGQGE